MPLDFAKTTIQCGSVQPVSQVLQAALQQHGPAGLFRGMVSFDHIETSIHVETCGMSHIDIFLPESFAVSCSTRLETLPVVFAVFCSTRSESKQNHRIRGSALKMCVQVQTPRVCQTAIMSAMFFTLFEFWKAQLKPHHHRASTDRLLEPKIWHKRRDHVWKRQFVQN